MKKRTANQIATLFYGNGIRFAKQDNGSCKARITSKQVNWLKCVWDREEYAAERRASVPRDLAQGNLLDDNGVEIGVWRLLIERNGSGILSVTLYCDLPKEPNLYYPTPSEYLWEGF